MRSHRIALDATQ